GELHEPVGEPPGFLDLDGGDGPQRDPLGAATAGRVEPAAADLDEAAVEGDGAAAALRGDDTTACPHRGAVSVLTDGLLLGRWDPTERTRGLGGRVVVVRGHSIPP